MCMWVGQDSIGAWIELFSWFFWVIAFKLDQGCNCHPVLGLWATMISSGFAFFAASSVKGIGRGLVVQLALRGTLFRSLLGSGNSRGSFWPWCESRVPDIGCGLND